jgi:molybdate transport system ATP-binding protein
MPAASAESEFVSLLLRDISLPLAHFTLQASAEIKQPVTVLFGPSGSGKTSLLDLIAGLRTARSAYIQMDDEVLTDTTRRICVPARHRQVGYVPQDLALFPHLSVRANLLYGRRPGASPHGSFDDMVDLLEIRSLVDRGVTQLSGGEKQRVALGRALLAAPRLLLLDEPLVSLDLPLKRKIIPYLARIRDEIHIPILYVTHDRFETLSLADEIIVLANGRISQIGSPHEVFGHPADLEGAGLLTIETILQGRVVTVVDGLATVEVEHTRLIALDTNLPAGTSEVSVCIHASDVIVVKGSERSNSARNQLPATVQSVTPEGLLTRVELDCGFRLAALLTKQACDELGVKPGVSVVALVKAPSVYLIPR